MAKFELPVYNKESGDVEKTVKRGFMPVSLYVRFQQFSEKVTSDKIDSDEKMFNGLKPLFCELFPELTEKEYLEQTDIAEVLKVFGDVINKSTEISEGNSKNA